MTAPHWTLDDHQVLVDMWHAGARVDEIAARLQRTENAVRIRMSQLRRLGVSIPARKPDGSWANGDPGDPPRLDWRLSSPDAMRRLLCARFEQVEARGGVPA